MEAMREAVLAACSLRPRVHAHQLAAARAGADAFELARAAVLDSIANRAAVAAGVGDRWRLEAAETEYGHAAAGVGPEQWARARAEGAAAAGAISARGARACEAYTRLQLAELEQALGDDADVAGARRALLEADPAFDPEAAEYRLRTPWAAPVDASARPPRLDRSAWDPPAAAGAPIGDPAAAYRPLAELPGATGAAAARLVAACDAAPTPDAAAARVVAEGLAAEVVAAPWRDRAQAELARRSAWPDGIVEHHWRALVGALDDARTATEAELAIAHADACFAVEADWNALLHAALLLPLRAALTAAPPGPAVAATHERTGLGPRAVLALPVVAALADRIAAGPAIADARAGEAGFDLLRDARQWAEASGRPVPGAAVLRELVEAAGLPEPPAAPRPLTLWRRPFAPGAEVAIARPDPAL